MQQIADWLKKLGMSEYTDRFVENRVDLSVLPDLTDHDLEKLLAQSPRQVAQHKAALGPIDGRAAHADAVRNGFIADARVGGQQDL